jgi:hypothetical protein
MGRRFDNWSEVFSTVVPVRTIAALEVVGGVFGGAVMLGTLARVVAHVESEQPTPPTVVLLLALLLALNVFAIVAGVLLWRGHRYGAVLSAGIQWAQLLQVHVPAFSYRYVLGAAVGVWITCCSDFGLFWQSAFQSAISIGGTGSFAPTFSINAVAVAVLMVLVRHQNRLEEALELPPRGSV